MLRISVRWKRVFVLGLVLSPGYFPATVIFIDHRAYRMSEQSKWNLEELGAHATMSAMATLIMAVITAIAIWVATKLSNAKFPEVAERAEAAGERARVTAMADRFEELVSAQASPREVTTETAPQIRLLSPTHCRCKTTKPVVRRVRNRSRLRQP